MFSKTKFYYIFTALSILALGLSACASVAEAFQAGAAPTPETEPTVAPGTVSTLDELMGAMFASDNLVEKTGEVEQPFFSVKGTTITINGAEAQVFEYPTGTARKAESDLISKDGSSIGTTQVSWVDQPNFWANGRIIVLYVGTDSSVTMLVTSLMGEPITSAE